MQKSITTIPFQFQTSEVRALTIDAAHWFVAKDVCNVLGIENHRDAVASLDDDERDGVGITDAIGRKQTTTCVNESGLYALIFKSRKPEAKAFRKWVTGEVLPALRKTGRYAVPAAGGAAEPDGRPGPEWRTMHEIAQSWNMNRRNAALRVTAMRRKGECEVMASNNPWRPYYYRFVNLPGPPPAPPVPAPQKHRYLRGVLRPDGTLHLEEYDPAREFWEIPRWLLEDAFFTDGSRERRDNKALLLEIARVATLRAEHGCAEARRLLDGAPAVP